MTWLERGKTQNASGTNRGVEAARGLHWLADRSQVYSLVLPAMLEGTLWRSFSEKRQSLIMIKFISIALLATLCWTAGSPRAAAQEADAKLARFFQDYLQEHFQAQPLAATRLGDHRF